MAMSFDLSPKTLNQRQLLSSTPLLLQSMAPKNPVSDQQPPPPELEESPESSSEEEESVSNKRIPPSEPETMEESSEEEDEEGSEEEGSEEEEEEEVGESDVEEEKDKQKSSQVLPDVQKQTTPPPQSPAYSGEEGEEEEESENSIDSPSASDFRIKAVTPPKPTLKDSKSISKRPFVAEKDDESDFRGKKKAKVNAEELRKDSSGGGAGRVWGEEDVIDLLQSMIGFKDEKGADPSSNLVSFYEFARGKLKFEFSNTQIYEKIRRLRIKFFNNMEKYEKGGEDLVFHKPHEAEAFDLSKKIWGKGGDGMINKGIDENVVGKSNNSYSGKAKKSGKTVRSVDKDAVKESGRDDHEGNFESKYPFLSHSFDMDVGGSFLRENMILIGDAKAKDLEGKWKKLREAEVEVLLMKMDLMKEHAKLVLEGMKKK